MTDLISREAAIDALTDENIEMNFDSVHDGEIHRTKRAAIRIVANLPTVDAVPVVWLEDKELDCRTTGDKMFSDAFAVVIDEWQKEQEAR